MCDGIAVAKSEFSIELVERCGLASVLHDRGGEAEYRFLYRDRRPRLPVWRDGRIEIVRWGNGRGESRFLPRTGWTWLTTVEEGGWRNANAVPVDIPAAVILDKGVWIRVRQGIRGLVVPDERGVAVAYVVCEPAGHYYRVMTRNDRTPVLIGEKI
jgi:hypothetical protein